MIYVVDSNFFIEAHRATYPLDVAHSFWNKVKQLADDGKIVSIDKVKSASWPMVSTSLGRAMRLVHEESR